jgi:hypothetical protein
MPKKIPGMTPEEQSEHFKREAQKLIDAGELNPTEADAAMERVMKGVRMPKGASPGST